MSASLLQTHIPAPRTMAVPHLPTRGITTSPADEDASGLRYPEVQQNGRAPGWGNVGGELCMEREIPPLRRHRGARVDIRRDWRGCCAEVAWDRKSSLVLIELNIEAFDPSRMPWWHLPVALFVIRASPRLPREMSGRHGTCRGSKASSCQPQLFSSRMMLADDAHG